MTTQGTPDVVKGGTLPIAVAHDREILIVLPEETEENGTANGSKNGDRENADVFRAQSTWSQRIADSEVLVPMRTSSVPDRERRLLLRRIDRADARRVKAQREWRAALLAANEAGIGSRALGEHVGLSHTRVVQLLRQARAERERKP